jgi:hypothetical protein
VSEIGFSRKELTIFRILVCASLSSRYFLISSLNGSKTLVLFFAPFGLPKHCPDALAATKPCLVRSLIISLSVCAKYP